MTEIQLGPDKWHQHEEMETWCRDVLLHDSPKSKTRVWFYKQPFRHALVKFSRKEDATAFLLKWL
jgi:hypothetical protein